MCFFSLESSNPRRDPLDSPYWGLNPSHCYPRLPARALTCMALAEGELTITPSSSVEFTDDIYGKFDSESNQFVRGTSSRSLFDIVLFYYD